MVLLLVLELVQVLLAFARDGLGGYVLLLLLLLKLELVMVLGGGNDLLVL